MQVETQLPSVETENSAAAETPSSTEPPSQQSGSAGLGHPEGVQAGTARDAGEISGTLLLGRVRADVKGGFVNFLKKLTNLRLTFIAGPE